MFTSTLVTRTLMATLAPLATAWAADPAFQAPPAKNLSSSAMVAPAREPGMRMIVTGRLFARDGKTPLAGRRIGVYHTDMLGNYGRDPKVPDWARLNGWLRTDSQGRFEIRTVRPGAYPQGNTPEHIHFVVEVSPGQFNGNMELRFEDDRRVSPEDLSESRRKGRFGDVRPVRLVNDTLRVERDLRVP